MYAVAAVPTYFHCVHMRKRACPLAKISLEFAEIIGRRDENFRYLTRHPVYRDEVKTPEFRVLPFNLKLLLSFKLVLCKSVKYVAN